METMEVRIRINHLKDHQAVRRNLVVRKNPIRISRLRRVLSVKINPISRLSKVSNAKINQTVLLIIDSRRKQKQMVPKNHSVSTARKVRVKQRHLVLSQKRNVRLRNHN